MSDELTTIRQQLTYLSVLFDGLRLIKLLLILFLICAVWAALAIAVYYTLGDVAMVVRVHDYLASRP